MAVPGFHHTLISFVEKISTHFEFFYIAESSNTFIVDVKTSDKANSGTVKIY